MKTIYLYDENLNKILFQYDELSELKKEFEKRKILIGDNSTIGYYSTIGDNIILKKNFYIVGSKHSMTYTGNNTLSIGCHNYTIDKWLEKFEIIGKKEGYSEIEIKEYKMYIEMAKIFHENLLKNYEITTTKTETPALTCWINFNLFINANILVIMKKQAIANIIIDLKFEINNSEYYELNDINFEEYLIKNNQEFWLKDNCIVYNVILKKCKSMTNDYSFNINSIFIVEMLNENSIDRVNLKNELNKWIS